MDYMTPEMILARQKALVKEQGPVLDLNSPALYVAVGVVALVVFIMVRKRKRG
jgi:hypothetical protein